jgi:L-ribulose-5-phosphate 3-epimerase
VEEDNMRIDRRDFLATATVGAAAVHFQGLAGASDNQSVKVGMCDWNLGPMAQPEMIPRAKEAHLEGIQVSVGTAPDNMALRSPEIRRQYQELGKRHGVAFPSVAAGLLNNIPLKSEPQAAVFVIDTIEAAAALGSYCTLLAFFAQGDLRLQDSEGNFKNVSTGPFKSYELDGPGVRRVVEVLKQAAPRARDLNIIIGLENTLTAEQNLEILEEVGSEYVQIYYDVGNSTEYGYDVPGEIRAIGNDRICEIHLKDWHSPMLGDPQGAVDFQASAEACRDIRFDKWYVLETSGRENRFIEDTRTNVAFAKKMFRL